MAVRALSQSEVETIAKQGVQEAMLERGLGSRTANLQAVKELGRAAPYVYRGKTYRVRPLPWEDGLKLMELAAVSEEIRGRIGSDTQISPVVFQVYASTLAEILLIAHMLVKPRGVPRWIWRRMPNRFLYATQAEVFDILRFCARCQTISPGPQARAGGPSTI